MEGLEDRGKEIVQQPESAHRIRVHRETKIPRAGIIDEGDICADRPVKTRQQGCVDVRGERGTRYGRVIRQLSSVIVAF